MTPTVPNRLVAVQAERGVCDIFAESRHQATCGNPSTTNFFNFRGDVAFAQVTALTDWFKNRRTPHDSRSAGTTTGTTNRDLPSMPTRRKELEMSVARNLGLDDPDNNMLALARDRWSSWRLEHEALEVVENLLDLPTWMRNAEPENADRVLLALAELASPEGGDDLAATGALAWLLLPGASLLAARLATLTPSIDEVFAAQLWVEARTFPWQRGRRVAANILMNARKAVMRDLGVGVAADPAWSRSILIAPTEDVWGVLPGPAADAQPEHELAELLEWACSQGVITEDDRALLVDVAATADRHQPRRAGRGHAGLLSNDVSTEVAHRHGVSPITIRRRTRRSVQALRDARKLSA